MLRQRRAAIAADVEPVFPDSRDEWRDPNNVRRVWRTVRDRLALDELVTHTLRKTVASFLDDAHVSTRKISDQLGHARVSIDPGRLSGASVDGSGDCRRPGTHHRQAGGLIVSQ